jgi:hypothetical protein
MTPSKDPNDGARVAPRVPGQTSVGRSRAQRARALRRRVISGAVALFVATWLLIAVVLASGHDPALAAKATVASASSTQTTVTTGTSGSTATTASGSTPTTTSSSTGSGSGSGVSAVTTQQS